MGTSLTGLTPATTYDALIKVGDNGPLSATAKVLSDGLGNDSPLAMSTTLVGIGTASPSANLEVSRSTQQTNFGDASQVLSLLNTSTDIVNNATGIRFRQDNGTNAANAFIGTLSSGSSANRSSLVFAPCNSSGDATERMRITSAGNVGIGTSTPTTTLQLDASGGATIRLQRTSASANRFDIGTDGTNMEFNVRDTGNFTFGGGNVGIGTSTPTDKLNLFGTNTTAYVSSSASAVTPAGGLNLAIQNNGTAGYTSLRFISLDGSNAFGYLGFINNTGVSGSFVFGQRTGGNSYAEQMRIDNLGNVGIGTTTPAEKLTVNGAVGFQQSGTQTYHINPSSNVLTFVRSGIADIMSVTANGLCFNGDTAAANALDDYEEGTFTATMTGSISNPTTPVTTTGTYTKIGNRVMLEVSFLNVNTTGASGDVNITGMPFTSGGSVRSNGSVSSYDFSFAGSSNSVYMGDGTTSVEILSSRNGSSWVNMTHSPGTGRYLFFSLTYRV